MRACYIIKAVDGWRQGKDVSRKLWIHKEIQIAYRQVRFFLATKLS